MSDPTGSPTGDQLHGRVRRALAWSAMTNLVLRAGSFAAGVVLARLLAPAQFGAYAVALAVQGILMTLADMGLGADLVRSERPERRAPTVGALGLLSGSVMAALMAATAGPVATAMGSSRSGPAIAVLSLTLLLAGAGVVPFAMLQRRFDQRRLFVIAAVDLVVSTTLTIVLVLAGFGVMGLAVARVVAQAVTVVLQFRLSGTRPRFRAERHMIAPVVRFGLPIALANLFSWALMNIDTIVISRAAGPAALGFYVLAFNVSTWPMTAIGQVARSVALPGFSEAQRSASGDRGIVLGAALAWTAAAPAGALMAVLASPVVLAVYGGRWSPAVPALVGLGLFGALRVAFDVIASYLYAHGASGRVLVVQLWWFVTLVPAMIVGTRWHGITGGAWAHVVVAVGLVLPAYLMVLRSVGVRLGGLARAVVVPTLASLPAALAAYVVARLLTVPVLSLLVGGVVGVAVFAALVLPWVRRLLARPAAESAGASRARVSVVIPSYNYAAHLGAAVHSALDQEGVDVEVIVVDDASADGSARLAEELAAQDPRVSVLRHLVNQGPVATFNDGLARARGEFLVRLDADDLLTPGSLARAVEVCRRFPAVGLVYGRPLHFTGEPALSRQDPSGCTVWSGLDWLEDRCRTGVNVITSPEALMRMSVVRRVGGQRPLAHTHDMELWMRIAAVADVAYVEGADQAWHREHAGSLSGSAADALGLTMLRERRDAFDTLFADPGVGPLLEPRLATLARRTLALEALGRACYEFDRGRAPAREVEPLVAFALESHPDVRELPQWQELRRRTTAGTDWLRHRPWLRLRPLWRIAEDRRRDRRWRRTGLYNPLHAATGAGLGAQHAVTREPLVGADDMSDMRAT